MLMENQLLYINKILIYIKLLLYMNKIVWNNVFLLDYFELTRQYFNNQNINGE